MAITLDEARGIVREVKRGIRPLGNGPTNDGIDWNDPGGGGSGGAPPPTTGGGGGTGFTFPSGSQLFNPSEQDVNETVYRTDDGIWRRFDGTPVPLWQQKMLDDSSAGGGSGGGSGDPYAANREARAAAGFASDEEQRRFNNAITWQDLLNSQKYADRNFAQGQLQDNRTEMGNRAGTALSFADFALADAQRKDQLANDPGNFPAWLAAMQGNKATGPVVQNLVGEGVSIAPQAGASYLDDPLFQKAMQSVLGYAQVPSGSDVDAVQRAYNEDPDRARRWFEAAAALDAGKGMAMGGMVGAGWGDDLMKQVRRFNQPQQTSPYPLPTLRTSGPMRFQDLTTGETVGVAGEQGPETVSVTPSEGTARALGKTLGAGGFSFFPTDVRQKLERGELPLPSELPDWALSKMPPSIRQLFAALIRSRLGGSGAEDYDYTRGLYNARGFSGAGGVVR